MHNIGLFNTDKTVFSFEVFPPKTTSGLQSITSVIGDLLQLNPMYMSVTYGAGGSLQDNHTLEICKMIKELSDIEPLAHMTCVGSTKQDIDQLVSQLKKIDVKNILTLRGDGVESCQIKGDFTYASDLAGYIKDNYGNEFCLGGACYPVGHIESESLQKDMDALKIKIDSGVSYLTTQLFFDNNEVYDFIERANKANLNVPISCGIMPLTNSRQIERMVKMSGATLPSKLSKLIAKYADNDAALREAGLLYATEQIVDLLANNVDGIHLYTMNNTYVASKISKNIKELL